MHIGYMHHLWLQALDGICSSVARLTARWNQNYTSQINASNRVVCAHGLVHTRFSSLHSVAFDCQNVLRPLYLGPSSDPESPQGRCTTFISPRRASWCRACHTEQGRHYRFALDSLRKLLPTWSRRTQSARILVLLGILRVL